MKHAHLPAATNGKDCCIHGFDDNLDGGGCVGSGDLGGGDLGGGVSAGGVSGRGGGGVSAGGVSGRGRVRVRSWGGGDGSVIRWPC